MFSWSMARCMALKEAWSMLILSISSWSTMATAQAKAFFSMRGRSLSLSCSVSCLLSFSRGWRNLAGRITAAAHTGPARQPLPASSHPASTIPFLKKYFKVATLLITKIFCRSIGRAGVDKYWKTKGPAALAGPCSLVTRDMLYLIFRGIGRRYSKDVDLIYSHEGR